MDNTLIEEIVNEVLKSINKVQREDKRQNYCNNVNEKLGVKDYPLIQKRKDLIKTKTGKNIDDINIENVISGKISPDDIKITQDVLLYQAQIADSVGRTQFAKNLRRAAELTAVPDERVLEIYNALRPYRSTKEELIAIADELENKYNAKLNAAHVREAAEVYEKRGRLKV